jgi:aspartate/methionine/tyrosine aminotransferase
LLRKERIHDDETERDRLAKRLDEVGFSDIVQIRNKVMELRAEPAKRCTCCMAASRFSRRRNRIKYAAIQALVENQTHYAPSSGVLPLRKALVEKLAQERHPRHHG